MIKFFRKIRQKLLAENKFSKYLIYAFGEIILVVIGILIALQINNWNEYRQDISKSRAILGEFKKDLASDTTGINRVVRLLEQRVSYEAWALSKVVYDKSQIDSLRKAFISPVHQEFIKDRTYKKLQVSQNPNLTGYLDLQNNLTTYYTDTKFLLDYGNQLEEAFMKEYNVNTLFRKELEMQLDPFPTLSSEDKQIETLISYAQTIEGRNFLKENYSRRSGMIRYFNRVKVEAQELIQKINTHLAREK